MTNTTGSGEPLTYSQAAQRLNLGVLDIRRMVRTNEGLGCALIDLPRAAISRIVVSAGPRGLADRDITLAGQLSR